MIDPVNLYITIQDAFNGDDDDPENVGRQLLEQWEACNEQEKAVMDNVFMCLTGWTFTTLLHKAK